MIAFWMSRSPRPYLRGPLQRRGRACAGLGRSPLDHGRHQLLRSFDASNMPCRTIDYTVGIQGTLSSMYLNHYVLNWCRIRAGVWKIVPVPTPD